MKAAVLRSAARAQDLSRHEVQPLENVTLATLLNALAPKTRQGPMPDHRVPVQTRQPQSTGRNTPNSIQLRPGMTAQTDIKACEHTALQDLAKPITQGMSLSLGEG